MIVLITNTTDKQLLQISNSRAEMLDIAFLTLVIPQQTIKLADHQLYVIQAAVLLHQGSQYFVHFGQSIQFIDFCWDIKTIQTNMKKVLKQIACDIFKPQYANLGQAVF